MSPWSEPTLTRRALAKKRLAETGLSVEGLARLSDGEVAGLFPDGRSRVSEGYEQPDFAKMARSMKANQHFTVLQGWRSYMASASSLRKYGYSQFCALFADYAQRNDLTAVIAHKPRSFMRAV